MVKFVCNQPCSHLGRLHWLQFVALTDATHTQLRQVEKGSDKQDRGWRHVAPFFALPFLYYWTRTRSFTYCLSSLIRTVVSYFRVRFSKTEQTDTVNQLYSGATCNYLCTTAWQIKYHSLTYEGKRSQTCTYVAIPRLHYLWFLLRFVSFMCMQTKNAI